MRSIIYGLLSLFLVSAFFALTTPAQTSKRPVKTILESYVEDFRLDQAAATARVFGIRVTGKKGGEWNVVVDGKKDEDGKWKVSINDGKPEKPTFIYTLDSSTLKAVDSGQVNALTVQGKALPSDITPMAIEWMPGIKKFDVNAFSFHFWTRGFPEKVPFRDGGTRIIHSSNIGVFYYQPGFRSAWASLEKGQGANNGPGNPLIAPFPTMIIITSGSVKGKVKGKMVEAKSGEMIFIPPMTPHEWWNDEEKPAEAILLFFGKGA